MGMPKVDGVSHPYIQLVVALSTAFATIGGGSAFWSYLQERDQAKQQQKIEALKTQIKTTDLESQIAALVELVADQGTQIVQMKDAVEKLGAGFRTAAREAAKGIDIPPEQGKRILRGRLVPTHDEVQVRRASLQMDLEALEESIKKK